MKTLKKNLFQTWIDKDFVAEDLTTYTKLHSPKIGEFSFYKYIDHPEKDAELVTASDIKKAIDYFNENKVDQVVLHYGHYFNADYDELFTMLHYFKSWYTGRLLVFSPEEIVFLAIVGDKDLDQVIDQLAAENITEVLGFLPDSISDSKYYADDDELFIDDRHVVLDKLISKGISFIYPFNIAQADSEAEFNAMIAYIEKNELKDIILQASKLIDSDELFDYSRAQPLVATLFNDFILPERALNQSKINFTDKSFEILFKFVHI